MVGKAKTTISSKDALEYILREKEVKTLRKDGFTKTSAHKYLGVKVLVKNLTTGTTSERIAKDFNVFQKRNTRATKKTLHFILSEADVAELGNMPLSKRKEFVERFAEKMNIQKNQYIAVEHTDTKNYHIHIVANRINTKSKAYKDDYIGAITTRNANEVAKEMGLTTLKEYREQSNKGTKGIRQEIHDVFLTVMASKPTLPQFIEKMKSKGVDILLNVQNRGKGEVRIAGYRIEYKQRTFKASEVHRSMSFNKIKPVLDKNAELQLSENPTIDVNLNLQELQPKVPTSVVKNILQNVMKEVRRVPEEKKLSRLTNLLRDRGYSVQISDTFEIEVKEEKTQQVVSETQLSQAVNKEIQSILVPSLNQEESQSKRANLALKLYDKPSDRALIESKFEVVFKENFYTNLERVKINRETDLLKKLIIKAKFLEREPQKAFLGVLSVFENKTGQKVGFMQKIQLMAEFKPPEANQMLLKLEKTNLNVDALIELHSEIVQEIPNVKLEEVVSKVLQYQYPNDFRARDYNRIELNREFELHFAEVQQKQEVKRPKVEPTRDELLAEFIETAKELKKKYIYPNKTIEKAKTVMLKKHNFKPSPVELKEIQEALGYRKRGLSR